MKTKSSRKPSRPAPIISAILEVVPARTTWQPGDNETRKQWVIRDATNENYDAMIELGAKAIVCNRPNYRWSRWRDSIAATAAREHVRNFLTAVGITRPTQ